VFLIDQDLLQGVDGELSLLGVEGEESVSLHSERMFVSML
jgi:hypothetical protein